MKKISGAMLIVLGTLFFSGCSKSQKMTSQSVLSDHQMIVAQIGNSKELKLEVVNTPQSITQGLSGRDELGADGMLFIYDQPRIPQFWMKEMGFNLDLVWIKDLVVVEVTKNVPAPDIDTPLSKLPTYSPQQSIDMVLELRAGDYKNLNIDIGDQVLLN